MQSRLNDFAVMILCHGRAENVPTYTTLRKYGYSGRIIIVCDDEDKDLPNYQAIYPEVEVFSKDYVATYMDPMDNSNDRRCAVYARNACFDIAEKLGLKYFAEYDDDTITHPYRYEEDGILYRSTEANLDAVFELYLSYIELNEHILALAFGQPGDYIGGVGSRLHQQKYRRKTMNSWICKTERRFIFNGRMNDDVNTYLINGVRGGIFLTFDGIMIDQPETQQVKGGMTDMYVGAGTYQKTFFSIIQCPSFVKVTMMGDTHYRMHHDVNWECAVPKIISGHYKKRDAPVEEWRDIEGYEGIYQVSNYGQVKSLERDVQFIKNTGTVFSKHFPERLLSQNMSTQGYYTVMLYKDNKENGPKESKRFGVHQLVANAFLNNPMDMRDVNHMDEDKTNNVVTNLEWMSHRDNKLYDGTKFRNLMSELYGEGNQWYKKE